MKDLCDLCTLNCPTSGCTVLSHESCLKEAFQLIKPSVTYREVIKTLFPNTTFVKVGNCVEVKGMDCYSHYFDAEWIDSPYQKENNNE